MNEMQNKVVLITGASTGIGRAAAQLFAEEGARVVLADLNVEAGAALQAELQAAGHEALFVQTNVGKAADCERMVAETLARFGRLDAAFNNAGISDGPIPPGTLDYSLELWDRIISVNLSGVFYCMKYEIRAMLDTAGAGSIVNTASIAGQIAFSGIPGYVASKHGVIGLSRAIAVEYGARGIRCNAIAPGFIDTPMTQPVFAAEQFQAALPMMVPLGRVATAREVAEAALWLCSRRSSYTNGTVLPIDGGFLSQ